MCSSPDDFFDACLREVRRRIFQPQGPDGSQVYLRQIEFAQASPSNADDVQGRIDFRAQRKDPACLPQQIARVASPQRASSPPRQIANAPRVAAPPRRMAPSRRHSGIPVSCRSAASVRAGPSVAAPQRERVVTQGSRIPRSCLQQRPVGRPPPSAVCMPQAQEPMRRSTPRAQAEPAWKTRLLQKRQDQERFKRQAELRRTTNMHQGLPSRPAPVLPACLLPQKTEPNMNAARAQQGYNRVARSAQNLNQPKNQLSGRYPQNEPGIRRRPNVQLDDEKFKFKTQYLVGIDRARHEIRNPDALRRKIELLEEDLLRNLTLADRAVGIEARRMMPIVEADIRREVHKRRMIAAAALAAKTVKPIPRPSPNQSAQRKQLVSRTPGRPPPPGSVRSACPRPMPIACPPKITDNSWRVAQPQRSVAQPPGRQQTSGSARGTCPAKALPIRRQRAGEFLQNGACRPYVGSGQLPPLADILNMRAICA